MLVQSIPWPSGGGNIGSQSPSLRAQGYLSSNVAFTADTKIPLNTDDYDPSSIFNTSNSNMLPTLSGYYLASGRLDRTATAQVQGYIHNAISGASRSLGSWQSGNQQGSGGSGLFYCDGSVDTLELRCANTGGTVQGGLVVTYLNVLGPFNKNAYQVASAYRSASQPSTSGSLAKLTVDTASFDPSGIFNSTNSRFQPTKAGYYIVGARVGDFSGFASISDLAIYKNGSMHQRIGCASNHTAMGGHCVVYLNGSTDYVEVYSAHGGTNIQASNTFFEIVGPFNGTVAVSYLSGSGSLTTGNSKVTQDAALIDTSGIWSTTNKRFIPNVAGYYWCACRYECTTTAVHEPVLWKNGAQYQAIGGYSQASVLGVNGDGVLIYLNGTTDYVEIYSYRSSNGTLVAGSDKTWFAMVGPF